MNELLCCERVSTHHARFFVIELPTGYEVLHGLCIVTRTQAMLQIQLMRFFNFHHIELNTQTRLLWHLHMAIHNLQGFLRETVTVLPNLMGVNGRDLARRGCCHVREHGQRHIEMVVGM